MCSLKFMSGRESDKATSLYYVQYGGICKSKCPEGCRKPCWHTVGPQYLSGECCWVKALDRRTGVLFSGWSPVLPPPWCFSVLISSATSSPSPSHRQSSRPFNHSPNFDHLTYMTGWGALDTVLVKIPYSIFGLPVMPVRGFQSFHGWGLFWIKKSTKQTHT